MRVLVTGANGHIGCNLLPELLSRGHEVVPFVRETSDCQGIDPLGLDYAFGDIRDADAVARAAEGCEAIIHMAAVYAYGGTVEEIVEPAMRGVENVLNAAKMHAVKRIVHTSSILAVGVSAEEKVHTEADWYDHAIDPYGVAKTQTERRAHELADELGLALLSLNPAAIIGRLDYHITPSNGLLLGAANGPGGAYWGGITYIDVRDVAWVHAEALTKGDPGERYLLTSDNVMVKDVGAHIHSRTGTPQPYMPVPRWMMQAMARMTEAGANLFGVDSPLQVAVIDEFYKRWLWYDNSRTRETFDWTPRTVPDLIDDGLLWLLHRDKLKPKVAAKVRETLGEPPDYP